MAPIICYIVINIFGENIMSKRLYQWLKNQPNVEVMAKAEDDAANNAWLVVFAFMGFFFFFSGTLWRALTGG